GAIGESIVQPYEHHGMTAMSARRFGVVPDVRLGQFSEHLIAALRCDERQLADGRRGASGGANEPGVLVVADRGPARGKPIDVNAMNGPFIDAAVGSSHEKIAGWNSGEVWSGGKRHRAFERPGSHLEVTDFIEKPV